MTYKYGYQKETKGVARAVMTDMAISTKSAIMICKFLRGKTVARARKDLEGVLAKKVAVPMTRFSEGAGHKPGIGPGKYPQSAGKAFLTLVNSVAANAEDLGLGSDLTIISINAHKGSRMPKYGRHRGRMRKSSHVEIVVSETPKVEKKQAKAPAKAAPKSTEQKPKPAAKAPAKKTAAKKAPAKAAPKKASAKKESAKGDAQ